MKLTVKKNTNNMISQISCELLKYKNIYLGVSVDGIYYYTSLKISDKVHSCNKYITDTETKLYNQKYITKNREIYINEIFISQKYYKYKYHVYFFGAKRILSAKTIKSYKIINNNYINNFNKPYYFQF